jgi:hypothetical protein
MVELKYIIEENGELLDKKIIDNPNLYPFLTRNLRDEVSGGILSRELFWKSQNIIKIFPFIYKEALKN